MNGDDASDPQRWLDYAEEDLRAAHLFQQRADFAPRHACWYAQQSAEKSLKGLTLLDRRTFERVHILRQLSPAEATGSVSTEDLDRLTDAGFRSRYPDSDPTPTVEDARRAVTIAGTIYDFVAAEFQRHGASG